MPSPQQHADTDLNIWQSARALPPAQRLALVELVNGPPVPVPEPIAMTDFELVLDSVRHALREVL